MATVFYMAYGSNLHPVRLRERVPSAKLVATKESEGQRVTFNKRSIDGSGKCSLADRAGDAPKAWTAFYELQTEDVAALDKAEGLGSGYKKQVIATDLDGRPCSAFTYVAEATHIKSGLKPYDWYHGLVLAGARCLAFPEPYLAWLESVETIVDPDPNRRADRMDLLGRLNAS